MPIRIKISEIRAELVIVCDHCGNQIESADDGGYEWLQPDDTEPGKLVDVVFLHKDCSYPHELASGSLWHSMELSVMLPYLVRNLSVDMEKATRIATYFNQSME